MKTIIFSLGLIFTAATALAVIQTKSDPDKPWRCYPQTYQRDWERGQEGDGWAQLDRFTSQGALFWADAEAPNWQTPGFTNQCLESGTYFDTWAYTNLILWPRGNDSNGWSETVKWPIADPSAITNYGETASPALGEWVAAEHCVVTNDFQGDIWTDTWHRTAQAVWHVQTGGKAVPGMLNLWQFNASVWEVLDPRAMPPFSPASLREITNKTQIVVGSMGNLLTNGVRYNLLPNGVDQDITPKVGGKDFYAFSVSGQKFCSYFKVFVDQPIPGTQKTYSDYTGHAFFGYYTDAPDEVLQSIHPELLPFENNNWGFYPQGGQYWGTTNGILGDDSHPTPHGENVSRVFYIGYPEFIAGLKYVKKLNDTPPLYSLILGSWGYSCVYAARAAGAWANISLPSDFLDAYPQNFGADILLQFPGPPDDNTPRYSQ